jgi:hypothetical protein
MFIILHDSSTLVKPENKKNFEILLFHLTTPSKQIAANASL